MLDRALGKVFVNLSTLLLLASAFTVPLFGAHSLVFRDELALRELAPDIRELPEGRLVRGVGAADIDAERKWLLVAVALSLAAAPLVYRGSRRIHTVEEAGGVPTVPDALSHLDSTGGASSMRAGPLGAAAGIGVVSAWLLWAITDLLASICPNEASWLVLGVGRGLSIAAFLAFVCGTWTALDPSEPPPPPPKRAEALDLY